MSDNERGNRQKQRPSQAIESVAKVLCENTVGPGGFDGPLKQAFLWKALMMYLDQRDEELAELVKQLRKAFRGRRARATPRP